jgi:hypothetical protein
MIFEPLRPMLLALTARQAGDQFLLQAELPGFGRQMHAGTQTHA